MTTASKEAYAKPENQVGFWTIRNICFHALKNEPQGMTFRQVAAKVRLKPEQCWRRMSELHTEGKIKIIGKRDENGNANSVYVINNEPELFYTKKLTLKQFVQQENPELLHKYEVLYEHKL